MTTPVMPLGEAECMAMQGVPFPEQIRAFVDTAPWRFAKTYAATWPHEYVVRTEQNAASLLALARHIFEHGVEGRFYAQVRKYHHEGGKVYWSMAQSPEGATLINRCAEGQTYDARLALGTLPGARRPSSAQPLESEKSGFLPA